MLHHTLCWLMGETAPDLGPGLTSINSSESLLRELDTHEVRSATSLGQNDVSMSSRHSSLIFSVMFTWFLTLAPLQSPV